ncbi:THO complex subunit 2 [Dorcoceras hygrometricum]|uniref:THO complex subunit 2 n=1 Tax=Dorcoceras hygrometricum TaxID=472368 RepID=A0A2Z7AIQ5_9LAMI|nr:THO complex subunit 2 [Dorcoceras hygrometricum]
MLVYEDLWRNLIECSLIVVRFWNRRCFERFWWRWIPCELLCRLLLLEVVERLVEVSVKMLVYEDLWRNLIECSLIVVRFWIFSSRESLPCLPSQERSGCLGHELQRLVRTLLRCVVSEKSYAIIGVVTAGFERLSPRCDGLTGSEDHVPMISPVDTPCGYRG